ncbi:hypothetical protein CJY_0011 [Vibrio phage CJY]|uniref:Uncharacterized protein n=3 Tax=Enhodamvirus VP2 TaxID=1922331 RepID=A0A2D0Z271_9CAUD|nr:hypothetical protein ACQ42_gp11 [Vibrio phage J2]YP_009153037.1 hypothetical protein ACQ41_gp11 [Vibrio phage QH]YP_052982.1 hypothetical protein VP2p11 [Vibrio phage VP2]AIZ01410.1 hypothetical protein CJY_0011 [Vibrio phage CJY]AIZ01458.1 hypothetical protein H1_0011 [Vibrio phage H1]AIZ01506.1 hypothetical protein H2_0011 [Vibrio phage H2 SGB-2014]AIZ01554.1 hypothetical protein H3_0011 [Vibrio phage H3]AIZ01650.1 hypothetical protein J3_0011 [Vibrio phage J3]ASV42838.1 hypothetical p
MIQLFANIIELATKRMGLAVLMLIVIVGYNTYQINAVAESVKYQQDELTKMVATQYAYDVLAFGLKHTTSDGEIVETVKKWKADGWSAQMGAIRTVCSNHPARLLVLMSEDAKRLICRLAG